MPAAPNHCSRDQIAPRAVLKCSPEKLNYSIFMLKFKFDSGYGVFPSIFLSGVPQLLKVWLPKFSHFDINKPFCFYINQNLKPELKVKALST